MKKHKNEPQLLKLAIQIGEGYAVKRGFTSFGKGTSEREKVECIYRLLVQDKLVQPLAKDKEDGLNIKHKLVLWITKQLPDEHPLLK
ncbi:DUF5062 family protein [Shewanella sp. 202IG2-18]|uniref:DUF5062 family protein n=1 Tax=Parashewanella hymeniacidonis TaxID=2807618 RepID=UPI00196170FA|nr:DUF5062 family protein [Parashewanella hymeniacidonis]MBM7073654.1 DUF5062 family protein [Parashewanella hymeniacidonis]